MVLLLFTGLTLVFSWPLPAHMSREVPVSGNPVDAMHLLYALTWSSQVLGDNPFHLFQATFFYPYDTPVAFLDHMAGLALFVAPVNWATGSMFWGFNAAWMLTFVVGGLGAYLLVRNFGAPYPAALLAGVVYSFYAFRFHNAGQINAIALHWIPFALFSLQTWAQTRRRRWLVIFLLFALLQFLSSLYSGVFLIVAALVFAVVWLAVQPRDTWRLLAVQRWAILGVVVAGVVASMPFLTPYLLASRAEIGFTRTLGETVLFSALPVDLVTPAGFLERAVSPWAAHARHPLFGGVVALSCAAFWILARGWRSFSRPAEPLAYLALAVAGGILALGAVLYVGDARIPLPFAVAFYAVPGCSFIRAPVRFALLGSLGLAVVAGLGLALVLSRVRRPALANAIGYGAVLLALVESHPGHIDLLNPLPHGIPAVYSWLGSVQGKLAVIELPMPATEADERVDHARYQLYSLVHKKRLVNGVAAYVPPITRQVRREMQAFPSESSVARLRNLGVNYVFLHTDDYPPEERARLTEAVQHTPGLNPVDTSGSIWVFDVVPEIEEDFHSGLGK